MRLDLENPKITARISGLGDGRARLVIDYPPECRDMVLGAFADVLRTTAGFPDWMRLMLDRLGDLEGRCRRLEEAVRPHLPVGEARPM